jgi:hypothetical protein
MHVGTYFTEGILNGDYILHNMIQYTQHFVVGQRLKSFFLLPGSIPGRDFHHFLTCRLRLSASVTNLQSQNVSNSTFWN